MEKGEVIRCDPADPRRCEHTNSNGQCRNLSVPGDVLRCPAHISSCARREERKSLHSYRLAKWQQRVSEFAGDDTLKSLNGEIGVLRLVLEETLNKCTTRGKLMMKSNVISDLVVKIDKLVNSCHRLEKSTGQLLGKGAILSIAAQMIEVLSWAIEEAAERPDELSDIHDEAAERITQYIIDYDGKEEEDS